MPVHRRPTLSVDALRQLLDSKALDQEMVARSLVTTADHRDRWLAGDRPMPLGRQLLLARLRPATWVE